MRIASHDALFLGGLCTVAAAMVFAGVHRIYRRGSTANWIGAAIAFVGWFAVQLLLRGRLFDSDTVAILLSSAALALWAGGHLLAIAGEYELLEMHPLRRPPWIGSAAASLLALIIAATLAFGDPSRAALIFDAAEALTAIGFALFGLAILVNAARWSVGTIAVAGGFVIVAVANGFTVLSPGELVDPARAFTYGLLTVAFLLQTFEHHHEASSLAASHVELLAYHDSLTGLPNRALFFDRLVLTLAQAERYGHRVAVLFFDLDRFKQVNDSLGHAAGDALLKGVADRIQKTLRFGDTLARFGGDEFTILLPILAAPEHAVTVAQKVLSHTRVPFPVQGRDLVTTSSVGISIFPDDGLDAESLIRNADAAMYRAKEGGGDRAELYSPGLNAASLAKLELENGLRGALEKGELELFYQPLIDLKDHAVFGTEALLRWNSAELGLVPPEKFLEAAEISGTIIPIGEWMLREACRQTVVWQREQLPDLTVTVKLGARQFNESSLPAVVRSILDETGLRAESLELEISESCAMADPERSTSMLRELKALGVHTSLGAFGTGHSALSHLQHLPIDRLKIDGRFVSNVTQSGDAAIVKAMITLAHGLGLQVIAEGVENETQLSFLNDHYCDLVQGYLFSAPLRATELRNFLRQHRRLVGDAMSAASWSVEKLPESALRKVLVVDDDASIRILVQRMLERARFQVETARDGIEAVSRLREEEFAAVFLDIMMPRLDGFGVIEMLKREKPHVLQNVIVMTAISPAALQRVAAEPIARVLPKPFDVSQIIATANECALRQKTG